MMRVLHSILMQKAKWGICRAILTGNIPLTLHIKINSFHSGAGGDLQKLLDEQVALPECTAKALLLQVLTGLRFLHANHIAHLDIKVGIGFYYTLKMLLFNNLCE